MRWLVALALFSSCSCNGQQVNWSTDPQWQVMPLKVEWRAASDTFNSSFKDAMGAWNHAAGCKVLDQASDGDDAQVSIGAYDGTACGHDAALEDMPGATAGTYRCDLTHSEVRFQQLTDLMSVFVIASHELGHVLGLAHDDSALMNPSPQLYHPEQLSGNPGPLLLPSDADGAAIRSRYCR